MNITEDCCSFELGKLLKEKGFDWPVQCTYDEYGVVSERWTEYSDNYTIRHWKTPCVTHQMALKWLREVHNLSVEVYRTACGYIGCIVAIPSGTDIKFLEYDGDDLPSGQYTTYEKACEAAIKYCLTNLI